MLLKLAKCEKKDTGRCRYNAFCLTQTKCDEGTWYFFSNTVIVLKSWGN